jgi:fluoroquinolone transport system permease protein
MKQLLTYDIKLQWRQGFWMIYIIVSLMYLAILFSIPSENRLFVSILFVLSDTSVLGVTFVGALVLLEKQQNVLQSLFVTPLQVSQYLWSKTTSLGLIALTMSIVLLVLPNKIDSYIWIRIYAIITSSIIFTLMGIGFASRVDTINQYFGSILVGSMVIFIPVTPFLLWEHFSWLVIFPVNAALEIMFPEKFHVSSGRLTADALFLLGWCFIAYYFARFQMIKNILHKA